MPETVVLPPRLNFRSAGELAGTLRQLQTFDVEIDAGAVEFVGALSGQVLLSARRTWGDSGRSLAITKVSDGFRDGLQRLGIAADLLEGDQ